MTVLIPAYKPELKLLEIISEILNRYSVSVVVVDDGSGPESKEIFAAIRNMNCTVLTHEKNLGKGRALKTGFHYILTYTEEDVGVVTADADGQHLVEDILKVAVAISDKSLDIVLGVREFTGKVPLRSRIGNKVSRFLFKMACGEVISDTQTGLRGFPISMLPWLIKIYGEHFEYETDMLLKAPACGIGFCEVAIRTVYQGNGSHYRAVQDSIRIGRLLVKALFYRHAGSQEG